jgi:outer membrane lipoprotein-sorting protein
MWRTVILVLLLPGQADPGEKLFRDMEAKLAKAKTCSLAFDINFEEIQTGKLQGSLASMSGNKARFEMQGKLAGKKGLLLVSDGTRLRFIGKLDDKTEDTPKKFDELVRAFVSRAGFALASFVVAFDEKPKDIDVWGVSEFRLGKKEKLGDRDAQIIEYTLTPKGASGPAPGPFKVTVWLDAETSLPVKRVITGKLEDHKMTITENYTKMLVDAKLDEKQFELPK